MTRRPTKRQTGQPSEAYLPLPPATFHILLALADGELHGYAIMKGVAARSEGTVRLGSGTLYGTLKRLLEAGLVEEGPACMSLRAPGCPATAERIYRLLLRAYPPAFRAEYGREMVLLFRDQCQESDVRTLRFWAAVICDVARSAPALRVEAWCERASESTRTMEVIMKIAAMLTVLLSVFGILNAVPEGVAGLKQTITGTYALAIVLGVFASVLLLHALHANPAPLHRAEGIVKDDVPYSWSE